MNWNAIGAIGEIAGAVAVLITLIYLARQIRESNRHDLLGAFQHWNDTINQLCESISESAELASIILRGRESYEELNEDDRFRFQHFHARLLNAVESHYFQMEQTALDDEYRRWTLENLAAIVKDYIDHPGTRSFWNDFKDFYPEGVRRLVSENIRPD